MSSSSQLAIEGMRVAAPAPAVDSPSELFGNLAKQFNWHASIAKYVVESCQMESLEDFAFSLNSREDASKLVAKIRDCPEELQMVQSGRVARAWEGVKEALAQAQAAGKRDIDADGDLDRVLDQKQLDSLDDVFWARMKATFPPAVEPSDFLKSRLHREVSRRLLSVRDVWSVRTLDHQMRTRKRREELGPNLIFYSEGDDADIVYERSVSQYLRCLRTLLIGYAKGGAIIRPGAPAVERRGDDSTLFVEVPYDVMLKYYFRAERQVARVSPPEQLAWLTAVDEAERSEWVDLFRNSSMTLGEVIKTVFVQRESMWHVLPEKRAAAPGNTLMDATNNEKRPRTTKAIAVPNGWGSSFKDGRTVCIRYNQNLCSGECPDGNLHVCAKLVAKGRVCGSKEHRAMNCTRR